MHWWKPSKPDAPVKVVQVVEWLVDQGKLIREKDLTTQVEG